MVNCNCFLLDHADHSIHCNLSSLWFGEVSVVYNMAGKSMAILSQTFLMSRWNVSSRRLLFVCDLVGRIKQVRYRYSKGKNLHPFMCYPSSNDDSVVLSRRELLTMSWMENISKRRNNAKVVVKLSRSLIDFIMIQLYFSRINCIPFVLHSSGFSI